MTLYLIIGRMRFDYSSIAHLSVSILHNHFRGLVKLSYATDQFKRSEVIATKFSEMLPLIDSNNQDPKRDNKFGNTLPSQETELAARLQKG